MDFSHWIQGLIGAGINSAASSFTAVVVSPTTFNVETAGGWAKIGSLVGVSALVGFALYLKQSPLPTTVERTSETKTTVSKEVVEKPLDVKEG